MIVEDNLVKIVWTCAFKFNTTWHTWYDQTNNYTRIYNQLLVMTSHLPCVKFVIEFVEMSEIETSVQRPSTRAECSRLTFHQLSASHSVISLVLRCHSSIKYNVPEKTKHKPNRRKCAVPTINNRHSICSQGVISLLNHTTLISPQRWGRTSAQMISLPHTATTTTTHYFIHHPKCVLRS